MAKERVCILGSGNWGSAIARIVGQNTQNSSLFEETVNMWVYEETINGRKLTEIINRTHENIRYLPNIKLPENIVAVPEVLQAVEGATILVFVVPHQVTNAFFLSLINLACFSSSSRASSRSSRASLHPTPRRSPSSRYSTRYFSI